MFNIAHNFTENETLCQKCNVVCKKREMTGSVKDKHKVDKAEILSKLACIVIHH
jgi:hypothetical protein